jgi:hypothetical protein
MFTNSYNPQRQLLLLRRQLSVSQQNWLIAAGAIFGVLLIISVLMATFMPGSLPEIQGFYLAAFTFGGLIFTSLIFKELHSPHRSYFFLTLPASSLEKLVGAWLITSPLYILGFTLLSFIIYFISFLISGLPFSLSYFFNERLGESILSYIVIQTIFLWGAVYFRKNNFLKTVLTVLVLGILLSIYATALRYLLLDNQMLLFVKEEDLVVAPGFPPSAFPSDLVKPIFQFTIWALGPYMLLMTYFTLKEREV